MGSVIEDNRAVEESGKNNIHDDIDQGIGERGDKKSVDSAVKVDAEDNVNILVGHKGDDGERVVVGEPDDHDGNEDKHHDADDEKDETHIDKDNEELEAGKGNEMKPPQSENGDIIDREDDHGNDDKQGQANTYFADDVPNRLGVETPVTNDEDVQSNDVSNADNVENSGNNNEKKGGNTDIKPGKKTDNNAVSEGDTESVSDKINSASDAAEKYRGDSDDANVVQLSNECDEEVEDGKSISMSVSDKKATKKGKTVRVKSSKTVSSIEVDMSRIMRSTRGDVDSDDDDAVTRITTTKSVEFFLPVDDEVEKELQRVIERPGSGRTSMMENEDALMVGRAATMNTPVTNDDRESFVYTRSIRTPSRDGIYEHALDLINNRCRSNVYSTRSQPHNQAHRRRQSEPPPRSAASLPAALIGGVPMFDLPNVVKHINQAPFIEQPNSFFYIAQERPLPLKPLKVWKGYRGNVYFEPMVCRKVPLSPQMYNVEQQRMTTGSSRFPSIMKSTGAQETERHSIPKSATTVRSNMNTTSRRDGVSSRVTKSAMSTRSGYAGRKSAILDKGSVLDRLDYNTAEDIRWISGIESTGTLQVGPSNNGVTGRAYKFYRNGQKHPKLRIRRGLVSHDLATRNKNAPKLGIRGGHINEDGSMVSQRIARGGDHKTSTREPGSGLEQGSDQEVHADDRTNVSQSPSSDQFSCIDPMSALQEIMSRNDGHGRSKLVHILPSANSSASSMLREKGK